MFAGSEDLGRRFAKRITFLHNEPHHNCYIDSFPSAFMIFSPTVSPVMQVPDQLIGSPAGSDVTMKCNLESYPRAMTFWMKSTDDVDDVMIITNKKYDVLAINIGTYITQMNLKIHNLHKDDFGKYSCHAKSAEGETSGMIKLYGKWFIFCNILEYMNE